MKCRSRILRRDGNEICPRKPIENSEMGSNCGGLQKVNRDLRSRWGGKMVTRRKLGENSEKCENVMVSALLVGNS